MYVCGLAVSLCTRWEREWRRDTLRNIRPIAREYNLADHVYVWLLWDFFFFFSYLFSYRCTIAILSYWVSLMANCKIKRNRIRSSRITNGIGFSVEKKEHLGRGWLTIFAIINWITLRKDRRRDISIERAVLYVFINIISKKSYNEVVSDEALLKCEVIVDTWEPTLLKWYEISPLARKKILYEWGKLRTSLKLGSLRLWRF